MNTIEILNIPNSSEFLFQGQPLRKEDLSRSGSVRAEHIHRTIFHYIDLYSNFI